MSAATVQIQTSRELVAFSQALIARRHEFEDSQAAALEEIGEQIAQGVRGRPASAKVLFLHAQVLQDRNLLNRRARLQAERNLASAPVAPTGWDVLA